MLKFPFFNLFFICVFCSGLATAQIPPYYSSIDFSQSGDNLKVQLSNLIIDTHDNFIVYTSGTPNTWDVLSISDLEYSTSDNVLIVYGYDNNDGMFISDRLRGVFEKCNFFGCAGTAGLWNREHVFAKSLANPSLVANSSSAGPGTDVHNLRAADSQKNTQRSNRLFIDDSGVESKVTNDGYFYPGDEWKGDVARIVMYMYLRYPSQCEAMNSATGSADYSPNGDMPDVFLEWNEEDPVSALELTRNDVISSYQGNRNPFIDNPYLATMIWNGPAADDIWATLSVSNHTENSITLSLSLADNVINLDGIIENKFKLFIINQLGQIVIEIENKRNIDVSHLPVGVYVLKLFQSNMIFESKFIVK